MPCLTGDFDGLREGVFVGLFEGLLEGDSVDGLRDGLREGDLVGLFEGLLEEVCVEESVGEDVDFYKETERMKEN